MFPEFPSRSEVASISNQFGVSIEQVRRDYVISVILDAIQTTGLVDDIIFFGGTALHRTFLNGRLSEDIDLLVNDRKTTALAIDAALKQRFLDIYGTFSASPSLSETLKDTAYAIFDVAGVKIKIQLLNAKGYPQWPTQMQTVNQRFEIFPSLEMKTPTIDSFVCAKTTAWCDRTRMPQEISSICG